jgi:hypothetical protein
MSVQVDNWLSFHKPPGISSSHFRKLIKGRVHQATLTQCDCEAGCHAERNEGRRCFISGFDIPEGYFGSALDKSGSPT